MTTMIHPPATSLGSSAVANVMMAKTDNKMTRGLRMACQNRTSQSWRFSRETSFGPTSSNRSPATASVTPSGDVSNSRKASAASIRAASARREESRTLGALLRLGGAAAAVAAGAVGPGFSVSTMLLLCDLCGPDASTSRRPENRKWEGGNRQANPQEFFHHPSFILSRGPFSLKPRTPKTFGAGVVIFSRGICPVNKL